MCLGAKLHYKLSTWTITTEVTTTVLRDSRTNRKRASPTILRAHKTTLASNPRVWVEAHPTKSRRKRKRSRVVKNRRIIMRSCKRATCPTNPMPRGSPLPS